MALRGFLFGAAVGATLMYLFDPRQGQQRRELWSDRVRRGREQAENVIETGRERIGEIRHHADEATTETQAAYDDMRGHMSSVTTDGSSEEER
jgi:gas vesicle protein